MFTQNLSTLKIHKLTQEQYNRELAAGNIDETALYLTPDDIKHILLAAHPVGSYYWSSEATEPSILFGGEWEQVQGKFILAAGNHTDINGRTETFLIGYDSGAYQVTLTKDNIPAHTHALSMIREYSASSDSTLGNISYLSSTDGTDAGLSTDEINGGFDPPMPIDNMPPYEVAYCWKRTA